MLLLLLLAWWPLSKLEHSLARLILGIVLLDPGGQALHVTNQSLILRTNVAQHDSLVALYGLFYATGSGLCTMATTVIYAGFGWQGVCLRGATVSLLVLIVWATAQRWMQLNNTP